MRLRASFPFRQPFQKLLESLPRTPSEQTKLEELLQSTLEDREGPAFQKVTKLAWISPLSPLKSNDVFFSKVMGMLLREEEDSGMDFTYDLDLRSVKGGTGYRPINVVPSAAQLQAYENVTRALQLIFKRHNAKKVRNWLESCSLFAEGWLGFGVPRMNHVSP